VIPTLGRIVLVRSPAFIGECPAIVVAVVGPLINVRAFTNDHSSPMFLQGVQSQADSSQQWGWRWPPRDPPVGTLTAVSVEHAPAVSAEEQLAKV
jgi:hypothetical protein